MSENNLTFEQAMKRLEAINEKLQRNECPLDEAINLYKEGLELSKLCSDKLNSVAKQLENIEEANKNDQQN